MKHTHTGIIPVEMDKDMDGNHRNFAVKSSLFFLFLILLQTPAEVQSACPGLLTEEFAENNNVGDVVANLTGGTFSFRDTVPNPNPFRIEGNQLLANMVFDYENAAIEKVHQVYLTCIPDGGGSSVPVDVLVFLQNVNDNAPFFEHNIYNISVSEMAAVGSTVGSISATDRDGDRLTYTLMPNSSDFSLIGPNNPTITVAKPLRYGISSNVELILTAKDSLTNTSTTIRVTIEDYDNRPPWFEHCTKLEIGETVICPSPVYSGSIVVNDPEPEVVKLDPPLLAIDGDTGINDTIIYSILSGNDENLFEIDQNTGSIRRLKAADKLGTITLTVLAVQASNSDSYATATVTITVKPESLHMPTFQKLEYKGNISEVGMVMDLENPGTPLQIIATDADYVATGGRSPYITYSITGSDSFSVIDSYVFMTRALTEGTHSLTVVASDSSTGDTATADLIVTVTPAPSTSTVPPTTTTLTGTTSTGPPSTHTTTPPGDYTTTTTGSTTSPSGSTGSPDSTTTTPQTTTTTVDITTTKVTGTTGTTITKPGDVTSTPAGQTTTKVTGTTGLPTTRPGDVTSTPSGQTTTKVTGTTGLPTTRPGDVTSTPSGQTTTKVTGTTGLPTTRPGDVTSTPAGQTTAEVTGTTGTTSTSSPSGSTSTTAGTATPKPPAGGYGPGDMAALGVVLGVLLLLSLILNILLMLRHRRWKADWKKLNEASRFTSTLGQSSPGEKDSVRYFNHNFQNREDGDKTEAGTEPQTVTLNDPRYESMPASSAALYAFLGDTTSQTSLISSDSEKDVKPILTKERRDDDGYKSVWFKEDIDPDAKNEVVIIPDSRDSESEEEHF